jgi:Flp pilus assembly pilin Flp
MRREIHRMGGVLQMQKLKALVRREDGQTMVEYGVILVLIAIGALVAIGLVGGDVTGAFQKIADSITP